MDEITRNLYPIYQQHPRLCTDSRSVTPGSVFFALKGDTFDGNRFAADALEKGAAWAVVDDPGLQNDRFIRVPDVLAALQQLAIYHRSRLMIPVIGITGTNGKTTTKELIHAVLSRKYRALATTGNLNNHIGVPLTLLQITSIHEIAVIEMGANHPGEIGFLSSIARPGFGIITNIGRAHLEGFGGFEGVVRTKTELYRYIADHGGRLFVNRDNPLLMDHANGIEKITYGTSRLSDYPGELLSADPMVRLTLLKPPPGIIVTSQLFGAYNFENIMAAAAIGLHFGIPAGDIREAIESYIPSNNRSQVRQGKKNLLVLDAYNANPSSMEAAIRNFARSSYPNKMIVLGDMLELGEECDREHFEILRQLDEFRFDPVVLVGPVFSRLASGNRHWTFPSSEEAAAWIRNLDPEGFTILIKGSRGIRLEKVEEELL